MITLYYVKGLTRLDEPVFDNLTNQEIFFANHKYAEIEDGFYPPYYRNKIALSRDDVRFDFQINYLSLFLDDKYYYYFIDSRRYVSEDVIELSVTMDTIQTYMFECQISDATIKKLSLKRWTDPDLGYINRNYVRENLSDGDFRLLSESISEDPITWVVVWLSDDVNLKHKTESATGDTIYSPIAFGTSTVDVRNKQIYTPLLPMFIPIIDGSHFDIDYVEITGVGVIPGDGTLKMLANAAFSELAGLLKIPTVTKAEYYAMDIFAGQYTYEIDSGTKTLKITMQANVLRGAYNYFSFQSGGNDYTDYFVHFLTARIPDFSDSTIIPLGNFVANRSKTANRLSSYVPAMLDENYLSVFFGEKMSGTSYPLHELATNHLYGIRLVDVLSGTRGYYMAELPYAGTVKDPFDTYIVCNTMEEMPLLNNAWNEYISRNQATWVNGYKINQQQATYKAVKATTKFAVNSTAENFLGLKPGPGTGVNDEGVAYQLMDWGERMLELKERRETEKLNYEFTPNTVKQGNSYTADMVGTSVLLRDRVMKVQDFDYVSQQYEEYGYSVALMAHSPNLFSDYNYRYYYNVVQASIGSMGLLDGITDESIIATIKARFEGGLRLWNTDNGVLRASDIGSFEYDNVETDFIKE